MTHKRRNWTEACREGQAQAKRRTIAARRRAVLGRRVLPAAALATLALLSGGLAEARAEQIFIDLTHPMPTFAPKAEDPQSPDHERPWGEGVRHPGFGKHAVLSMASSPTDLGDFLLGRLVLSEHHGTHVDAPNHFANNATSLEQGGIPADRRKAMHQLSAEELIGRVVLIDISARVERELARNGGEPSPDPAVTDFSNGSGNVVGPADIAAVAEQLDNGVWLVLNLGWSRFFFDSPYLTRGPYINGWNHPGLSAAAVDTLIEVMEDKGIRINGIVADNLGIDTGDSAIGPDRRWSKPWYAHVRLLQRGLLFVENTANLAQLSEAVVPGAGNCLLMVGALKYEGGTGGPARVMSVCNAMN